MFKPSADMILNMQWSLEQQICLVENCYSSGICKVLNRVGSCGVSDLLLENFGQLFWIDRVNL